jgi:cytidyltransferase-like protein
MQPIGIFGGTFDPIHCGHLRTAFELWQELRLAEVRLLPAGTPPHRDQLYASAEMRLQMVRAAVAPLARTADAGPHRRGAPPRLARPDRRPARGSHGGSRHRQHP